MQQVTYKNSEVVKYTGFNGWFNPATGEVTFCGRVKHFEVRQKGYLKGIEEDDVFGVGDKPRAKDNNWSTIRSWAAKYNWTHFVHDEDKNELVFYGCNQEQVKKAKAFAQDANICAVFKGEVYNE